MNVLSIGTAGYAGTLVNPFLKHSLRGYDLKPPTDAALDDR